MSAAKLIIICLLCTRRVHLSATTPAKLSQQTAQYSRRSRRYADRIICTGLLYSLSQKVSCFSVVCFLLVLRFVMYCESRGNTLKCTEKNNVRLVQTPCSTSLFGANVTSRSVDNYCQAWPSLSLADIEKKLYNTGRLLSYSPITSYIPPITWRPRQLVFYDRCDII